MLRRRSEAVIFDGPWPSHSLARRDTEKDVAAAGLVRTSTMIINYLRLQRLLFLSSEMENLFDISFGTSFLQATGTGTQLNSLISPAEYANLTAAAPTSVPPEKISAFLSYFNDTVAGRNNVLDSAMVFYRQFLADTLAVQREGFSTIYDAHMAATDMFNLALTRTREGICAKVTIKILQQLVLTRQGFEARLELDNSGDEDLSVRPVLFFLSSGGSHFPFYCFCILSFSPEEH